MSRPGFLFDSLWIATLLGIKETSFHKVEKLFKSTLYTGIFSIESNPRWWKASVLAILSVKVKERGLSQEKGRKLDGIRRSDYSQCFVEPTEIPDTVAFEDETISSNRHPMSLKNTIPHPLYTDMLFFEQIRMMKPEE